MVGFWAGVVQGDYCYLFPHDEYYLFEYFLLLLISGSVHPNPGPFNLTLSVAHLNARSGLVQATLMRGSE